MKQLGSKLVINVNEIDTGGAQISQQEIIYLVQQDTELTIKKQLSDKSSGPSIQLTAENKLVRFVFKYQQNEEIIGSVAFNTELFSNLLNGSYTQWISLFDNYSYDTFEGIIGATTTINTTDTYIQSPKVYFTFIVGETHGKQKSVNFGNLQNSYSQSPTRDFNKNLSITGTLHDSVFDQTQQQQITRNQQDLLKKLQDLINTNRDLTQNLQGESVYEIMDIPQNDKNILQSQYIAKYYVESTNRQTKHIKEFEKELAKLRYEATKLRDQIQDLEKVKNDLDLQYEVYDSLVEKFKNDISKYTKDISQLQDQNYQLNDSIQTIKKNNELNALEYTQNIQKLETELRDQIEMDKLLLDKQKANNQALNESINDKNQQIAQLNNLLQKEQNINKQLKKQADDQSNNINYINKQLADQISNNLNELQDIQNENKFLQDNINKFQEDKHSLEKQIDQLDYQNTKSQMELQNAHSKINELQYKLENSKNYKLTEIKALQDKLDVATKKINQLEKQNSDLHKQAQDLFNKQQQQQAKELGNDELIQTYIDQLKQSEDARNQLQLKIQKLTRDWTVKVEGYKKPDYTQIQKEREDNRIKQQELINSIASKDNKISELTKELNKIQLEYNNALIQQKDIDGSLQEQIQILRQQIKLLEDSRNQLTKQMQELTEDFIYQTGYALELQHVITFLSKQISGSNDKDESPVFIKQPHNTSGKQVRIGGGYQPLEQYVEEQAKREQNKIRLARSTSRSSGNLNYSLTGSRKESPENTLKQSFEGTGRQNWSSYNVNPNTNDDSKEEIIQQLEEKNQKNFSPNTRRKTYFDTKPKSPQFEDYVLKTKFTSTDKSPYKTKEKVVHVRKPVSPKGITSPNKKLNTTRK